MRAKITDKNGYAIALDGHTTTVFPYGAIVEGYAAEKAIRARKAAAMFPEQEREKKVEAAPEVKRGRKAR